MAQHATVGIYGTLDEAAAAVRSLGSGCPFALLGGAEAGLAGPMPSVGGWLFQLGLGTDQVMKFDGAIKAGKFLVVVHGSKETASGARDVLAKSGAEQLDLHAPASA